MTWASDRRSCRADSLSLQRQATFPAAAHSHDQADDGTAALEARGGQAGSGYVRDEGVGRQEDLRSGNQDAGEAGAEALEEGVHALQVRVSQGCEARQGRALVAVEGGGLPPDAAVALAELALLDVGVFDQSVGRIGDDGMNAIGGLAFESVKAVGVVELGATVDQDGSGAGGCLLLQGRGGHAAAFRLSW